MADEQKVRLVHPETGGEFECHPDAVAAWQERGWKRVSATGAKTTNKKESDNG
jgi:hypothetical protein